MTDLPYIPLVGGRYDARRVADPKRYICEDDILRIFNRGNRIDLYVVTERFEAVPTCKEYNQYGHSHIIRASELETS